MESVVLVLAKPASLTFRRPHSSVWKGIQNGTGKTHHPCLDVKGGRVVKGVNFLGLRDAGNPVDVAKRYNDEGADELTFLDITASSDNRDTILHVIEDVASQVSFR